MNTSLNPKFNFLPAFLVCLVLTAAFCFTWLDFYVDDAFIGFHCIDNLLNGHGLVFNPGEQVESVTNLAWLLTITPLATIMKTHLAGKTAGILSLIAAACLLTIIGSRIDSSLYEKSELSYMRYIIPILIFTSPSFVYFSQSGMETAFVCLLIGLPLLLEKANSDHRTTAVIYAFTTFVRPECIILFPVYLLAVLISNSNKHLKWPEMRQSILPSMILWGSVIIGITILRFAYYGDIVPNTFYAKPSSISEVIARAALFLSGKLTNLPTPYSGLFFIPFFLLGAIELARINQRIFSFCLAGSMTGLIFSIYSCPDWTLMPRYMAPYSPYCLFIIFAGFYNSELTAQRLMILFYRLFSCCVFVFLLLNNFLDVHKWLGDYAVNNYPGFVLTCKTLREPVEDINKLLPATAVIATRRIGLIAYVTRRQIFDHIFSLPHSDLAIMKKKKEIRDHDNPTEHFLRDIWRSRQPTHFLEDESKILNMLATHPGTRDQFEIHGINYKLLKSYKIGDKENWLLYAKLDE